MSEGRTTVNLISPCTALGIAFVVLKLCNVIDWSWWWVTCPFWAGIAILLAFLIVCLLVLGIVALVEAFE